MGLPSKGWKNKKGTSGRNDSSTMKSLWEKKYPWPEQCSVCGCNAKATDGAHMVNSNSGSMEEYIVPTCHFHNEQEDIEIALKPGTKLHKLKEIKE